MAALVRRWHSSVWSEMRIVFLLVTLNVVFAHTTRGHQALSPSYYDKSCPNLESTISSAFSAALKSDARIGASLIRFSFHDCFVQGCDGSILLDDTKTFTGEQGARGNNNSLRGYDVIDDIKTSVESTCPATVSCADILALVGRNAVVAAGGPSWTVEYGRRDSKTANFELATNTLPFATDDVSILTSKFSSVGLDQTDMVALSGAHTFGKAQCIAFRSRLYNFSGTGQPDPSINLDYLSILRARCPEDGSPNRLKDLDQKTPTAFDNSYYANLQNKKGLLTSDQVLQSEGGETAKLVTYYHDSQKDFFKQFASSMMKVGRINPLTGKSGEIRTKCHAVNTVDNHRFLRRY